MPKPFALASTLLALALAASLPAPSGAAEPPPAAETKAANAPVSEEQFLNLVGAYQASYFQLAAVSAFQVYSTCGLIDGSFRSGMVDGPQASGLLGQNSLLHSVCYSTLSTLRSLTPPDDSVALGEMVRLAGILDAEQKLIDALDDMFAGPGEATSAAADKARADLEAQLDAYAGEAGGGEGSN